jgi:hypothetical protein
MLELEALIFTDGGPSTLIVIVLLVALPGLEQGLTRIHVTWSPLAIVLVVYTDEFVPTFILFTFQTYCVYELVLVAFAVKETRLPAHTVVLGVVIEMDGGCDVLTSRINVLL